MATRTPADALEAASEEENLRITNSFVASSNATNPSRYAPSASSELRNLWHSASLPSTWVKLTSNARVTCFCSSAFQYCGWGSHEIKR